LIEIREVAYEQQPNIRFQLWIGDQGLDSFTSFDAAHVYTEQLLTAIKNSLNVIAEQTPSSTPVLDRGDSYQLTEEYTQKVKKLILTIQDMKNLRGSCQLCRNNN
jgi:hypothetical protein